MTTEPKSKLNNTRYLILLLLIYFQNYYIARKGADLAPLLYKLEQKKQQKEQLRQPSWSNILPRFLHRKKFDFV